MTPTRSRPKSKHGGAVQVRGMIRRVWRPRYLEIDHDGVLRYYEAVDPIGYNITTARQRDIRNEMQAFSIPDTLTVAAALEANEDGSRTSDGSEEIGEIINEMAANKAGTHSNDDDYHIIVEGPNSVTQPSDGNTSTDSLEGWNSINVPDPRPTSPLITNEAHFLSPHSGPDGNVEVTLTPHHQIHDHRPKAVMTILSARLINVSSLRDVHVGLPKSGHGFVFCGRQIFSERDAQSHGTSGSVAHSVPWDNFEIRDDICHPLSILSVNEQYFDTSRDYLCSVATEEEAQIWVAALKWAANIASQSMERNARIGRGGSRSFEGNEISIRGSFDDAGSPARNTRRRMLDDLTMGNDDDSGMDLTRSLLSDDSSTVMTDPNVSDGYTIVTKVRKFHVKQTDRVRLVGLKCEIVFEIELLLLDTEHLINRSKERNEADANQSYWDVEQRTIFRTYREVLQLLSIALQTKGHSLELQIVLETMNKLCSGRIIGLSEEVKDSVKHSDNALRVITSDPKLCDTKVVKEFLGLTSSSEHDLMFDRDKEQKSRTLHIRFGDSVDEFVKQWLSLHDEETTTVKLREYGMLSLRSPIVEALLSAKLVYLANHFLKLCSSKTFTINIRADAILALFGAAFYLGDNFGWRRCHRIRNIDTKILPHENTIANRVPRMKAACPITLGGIGTEDEETETFDCGSTSDDAYSLPSPLPMYPDNEGLSCWSRPNHKIFNVRGASYLQDRIKIPSDPSPFRCRGVDMWLTDNPERNISRLPCVLGGKLGEEDTFLVNFLLPFGNFVMYFSISKDMPKNVADVWHKFKNGDQMYRDARLKLLPVVIEGPWIVKKAVGPGTAPALLSQSIPLQYYFTPASDKKKGIYEVDVIITASRIAKGILNVVKSHTKKLTMALSIIIEATTEAELPETVLCSSQLHSLILENCPQLPKYYLDDDV